VRGDYKKADIFFERVLEIEPNNIDALNGKGTSLYRLADYDKAKKCFDKVLKMDPKNIVAFDNIEILGKKKEDDSSQQKIEKPAPSQGSSQQKIEKPAPSSDSGTIPPADSRNPYNDPTLPNYNPDLGKKNDSMQSIQEPLQPYPNDALTWNNEGMSLYTLDRYEEAIRSYDKAIELDPNLATALFIRASIKAKKGETENALADLKKAIESDKEYIESAKQAKDFEIIRNDERFKDLIMK
jgi:tetratricopeptide (TPR) repeat protein